MGTTGSGATAPPLLPWGVVAFGTVRPGGAVGLWDCAGCTGFGFGVGSLTGRATGFSDSCFGRTGFSASTFRPWREDGVPATTTCGFPRAFGFTAWTTCAFLRAACTGTIGFGAGSSFGADPCFEAEGARATTGKATTDAFCFAATGRACWTCRAPS